MIAEIWTQEGCAPCIEEKAILLAEGYAVDVVVVDDPKGMDLEASVQLHLQDGMFPVVRVGGVFRVPASISAKMEW